MDAVGALFSFPSSDGMVGRCGGRHEEDEEYSDQHAVLAAAGEREDQAVRAGRDPEGDAQS